MQAERRKAARPPGGKPGSVGWAGGQPPQQQQQPPPQYGQGGTAGPVGGGGGTGAPGSAPQTALERATHKLMTMAVTGERWHHGSQGSHPPSYTGSRLDGQPRHSTGAGGVVVPSPVDLDHSNSPRQHPCLPPPFPSFPSRPRPEGPAPRPRHTHPAVRAGLPGRRALCAALHGAARPGGRGGESGGGGRAAGNGERAHLGGHGGQILGWWKGGRGRRWRPACGPR